MVEFPKMISRKFMNIMLEKKDEFCQYLILTGNEKGFNKNSNYEELVNKFKNEFESFFEMISETIKRLIYKFDNVNNYQSQFMKEKLEMLRIFSTLGAANGKQNERMMKCLDFVETYLK